MITIHDATMPRLDCYSRDSRLDLGWKAYKYLNRTTRCPQAPCVFPRAPACSRETRPAALSLRLRLSRGRRLPTLFCRATKTRGAGRHGNSSCVQNSRNSSMFYNFKQITHLSKSQQKSLKFRKIQQIQQNSTKFRKCPEETQSVRHIWKFLIRLATCTKRRNKKLSPCTARCFCATLLRLGRGRRLPTIF